MFSNVAFHIHCTQFLDFQTVFLNTFSQVSDLHPRQTCFASLQCNCMDVIILSCDFPKCRQMIHIHCCPLVDFHKATAAVIKLATAKISLPDYLPLEGSFHM